MTKRKLYEYVDIDFTKKQLKELGESWDTLAYELVGEAFSGLMAKGFRVSTSTYQDEPQVKVFAVEPIAGNIHLGCSVTAPTFEAGLVGLAMKVLDTANGNLEKFREDKENSPPKFR